jgi:hypothetical protein
MIGIDQLARRRPANHTASISVGSRPRAVSRRLVARASSTVILQRLIRR